MKSKEQTYKFENLNNGYSQIKFENLALESQTHKISTT